MTITRESIVASIKDHLARVRSHPNQREREDLLMETNDKLASAITMLLDRTTQDEATIKDREATIAQQSAELDQLKADVASAGDAAAWDAKAKDLLARIEAIVGPVPDTSGAPVA